MRAAFLARAARDQEQGGLRSLEDYQAAFPHFEDVVEEEYARLVGPSTVAFEEPGSPEGQEPTHVGPYRLIRFLGAGGFGIVYLAHDPRLNRLVALKVLNPSAELHPGAIRRFRREAQLASHLDDPGLCRVFDVELSKEPRYIVMEHVEGWTLERHLREVRTPSERGEAVRTPVVPLPDGDVLEDPLRGESPGPIPHRTASDAVRRVLLFVESIARAVHVAHEAGIVHRDLKPGNVIVTPEGRPVILDFGLAQEVDSATYTRVVGTPHYMAPEQIRGDPLDRRADVWALGVMFYECLTLRRPFEAVRGLDLEEAIRRREPSNPRLSNPAVSRDLKIVLETALEKDRDRRYQTMLDLAEDLRRVRERQPIRARKAGSWLRLRRWAQRNPALAVSVSAVFVLLVVGFATNLVERHAREVALRQYEQMADVIIVRDLSARAEALWPRREANAEAMGRWVAEARAVHGHLASHERALASIESRGRRKTKDELAAERTALGSAYPRIHAEWEEKGIWLQALREYSGDTPREEIEEERGRVLGRMEEMEADPRLVGSALEFARNEDRWRHAVLTGLVRELRRFPARIRDMEERRAFALELEDRSIGRELERWEACAADLGASSVYGGLELLPQIGLVPLGRDERSRLWEFWHVGSGPRPDWEGELHAGRIRFDQDVGIVLVLLPGGRSWMETPVAAAGAVVGTGGGGGSLPQGKHLSPFFLSKYEMTKGQWMRLMGDDPSNMWVGKAWGEKSITARNPVEYVDWHDSMEATRRLELTLPTEVQWEYAARAGTSTLWWAGATVADLFGAGNLADASAAPHHPEWVCEPSLDDGHSGHSPVGCFRPNPFGLHDVIGNVAEWCLDRYFPWEVEPREGDGLRLGDNLARNRIFRGGSFDGLPHLARSDFRDGQSMRHRSRSIGLRPARPIDR